MMDVKILLKLATHYNKVCLAAQFNFDELDAEPTLFSKMQYCNYHLSLIGKGGSRLAYRLSSKKALKIATQSNGRGQNQTEVDILTSAHSKLLPKFYRAAPDCSWIEVELVRPIYGWAEFEELSGMDPQDFVNIVRAWRSPETEEKKIKYADNDFFQEFTKLIDVVGVDEKELLTKQNFGKNSDGQLVVLDVGFFINTD